jgi:hypothetical protein
MSNFQAEILTPDKQDKVSFFFRVLAPGVIWAFWVNFARSYYAQNGYPYPFMLGNGIIWLTVFSLPLLFLYLWYHKVYDPKGTIEVSNDLIKVDWEDPKSQMNYPISELKDLTVVYDGYPMITGPFKGTENQICFTHKGNPYTINLRLTNEEHASDFAKALRSWYEAGVSFREQNTAGQETYLLFFNPADKPAIA